jgi:hypothetical protein
MRLTALYLIMFLISGDPCRSCSCSVPSDPRVALSAADVVFEGTVLWRRTSIIEGKDTVGGRLQTIISWPEVVLQVRRVWKGRVSKVITLETDDWSPGYGGCGYEFAIDSTYLVYASRERGRLETSICTRTALRADATFDLEVLGEGRPPRE